MMNFCNLLINPELYDHFGMEKAKILAKLKGESDRERVSLYLSKSLLKDFKKACGDVSASKVIEELMREFLKGSNSNKKN